MGVRSDHTFFSLNTQVFSLIIIMILRQVTYRHFWSLASGHFKVSKHFKIFGKVWYN